MEALKKEFRETVGELLGEREGDSLCDALDNEAVTGVRMNPRKPSSAAQDFEISGVPEWCSDTGLILKSRPQFALMPLWHGGAFYVQEPASMVMSSLATFVAEGRTGLHWLDLCAAPGGKTTAVLAALPDDSFVVANEFDPRRAMVLNENISKWGAPNVALTRGDTAWVKKLGERFDVVAVDAPCSGEGMMRKEPAARSQWSKGLVEQCASLQREILSNAWEALRPGGWLIYSTCTFNRKENEDNVRYMMERFGAENVAMPTELYAFGIQGAVDKGIHALRFMPHHTEGEGLFVALMRKPGEAPARSGKHRNKRAAAAYKGTMRTQMMQATKWLACPDLFSTETDSEGDIYAIPLQHIDLVKEIRHACPSVMSAGLKVAAVKGKDLIPTAELALSTALSQKAFPLVEMSQEEALDYLRRGTSGALTAIQRSNVEGRGYVLMTYRNIPLGFVKNLGNRINNLYPAAWRLRMN